MDCSLKPPERSGLLMGRGSKRKRGLDENGGPLSEPEEGPPATFTNSWEQRRKIKSKLRRKGEAKVSTTGSSPFFLCRSLYVITKRSPYGAYFCTYN